MVDVRDPATWPSLAETDPEFLEACKSQGGPPGFGGFGDIVAMRVSMQKARAAANAAFGGGQGPPPGVKENDKQVQMRDGHFISVRIHAPESPPSTGSPLAVVYHGGGFCLGDLHSEQTICRLLVAELGVTVVNVDYRLGPEYKFPTAVHDCFDSAKWAAEHASELDADLSRGFIIGGQSAGGNMACVVSHLWRDQELRPKITGVHLRVPILCQAEFYPEKYADVWKSWHQLPDAPMLNPKAADLFFDSYIPNKTDRADPTFSPLLWKSGHAGLPPHYLQVSGADPCRDDGLIYERELREQESVKTRLDVYPGQPHGFHTVFPKMKASQKFFKDAVGGVKWLLDQN